MSFNSMKVKSNGGVTWREVAVNGWFHQLIREGTDVQCETEEPPWYGLGANIQARAEVSAPA